MYFWFQLEPKQEIITCSSILAALDGLLLFFIYFFLNKILVKILLFTWFTDEGKIKIYNTRLRNDLSVVCFEPTTAKQGTVQLE